MHIDQVRGRQVNPIEQLEGNVTLTFDTLRSTELIFLYIECRTSVDTVSSANVNNIIIIIIACFQLYLFQWFNNVILFCRTDKTLLKEKIFIYRYLFRLQQRLRGFIVLLSSEMIKHEKKKKPQKTNELMVNYSENEIGKESSNSGCGSQHSLPLPTTRTNFL